MLQAEQKAIFNANEGGRRPLTWAQTRNMPLTYRVCPSSKICGELESKKSMRNHEFQWLSLNFQVILESLRMASIISFTFREAAVDVKYKGKKFEPRKLF